MKFTKRTAAVLTAALMLVGTMTACGSNNNEQSSGTDETGKTYRIVADNAFAPFEFLDEASGKYVGVDMDILAAIAEDQGFSYTIDNCGWDAAIGNLQSGQADGMIAGMSITDERKKSYDFSDGYYTGGQIMILKADSTITSYEELAGKTVAVKTGTESQRFANSIADEYGFTTVTYKDSPSVYAAVAGGNDAAGFEDYAVISYQLQSKDLGLKMVGDQQNYASYGFAVKKDSNPELLEMFNAGLANIQVNGTYNEILANYGIEVDG